MMDSLVNRYHDKIVGVLSCRDRVVGQGTLPGLCYAAAMTSYLHANHIRIFDYPRFAQPLRDRIRNHAEHLARKAGVEALLRGEDTIHGVRNKDLRHRLPLNAGQVSRLLKRLRVHGLIKRIGRTYKYYLTALGRRALIAGLPIRSAVLPKRLTAET